MIVLPARVCPKENTWPFGSRVLALELIAQETTSLPDLSLGPGSPELMELELRVKVVGISWYPSKLRYKMIQEA